MIEGSYYSIRFEYEEWLKRIQTMEILSYVHLSH
uniref:Type II toxin-antitoxin system RelE/ParE family toxin n=1 Tax=Ascaris lumbricoides TaxID=6252 RepID=A0A0M3HMG7_ASCLU